MLSYNILMHGCTVVCTVQSPSLPTPVVSYSFKSLSRLASGYSENVLIWMHENIYLQPCRLPHTNMVQLPQYVPAVYIFS
jgi:hypothetical protein